MNGQQCGAQEKPATLLLFKNRVGGLHPLFLHCSLAVESVIEEVMGGLILVVPLSGASIQTTA